jgi:lipopolysaccharide transport system permease protein
MFASPVIYPVTEVSSSAVRVAFFLNPMTGVIGAFRWALLDQPFPGAYLWVSIGVITALFLGGLTYFKRTERIFADVV